MYPSKAMESTIPNVRLCIQISVQRAPASKSIDQRRGIEPVETGRHWNASGRRCHEVEISMTYLASQEKPGNFSRMLQGPPSLSKYVLTAHPSETLYIYRFSKATYQAIPNQGFYRMKLLNAIFSIPFDRLVIPIRNLPAIYCEPFISCRSS